MEDDGLPEDNEWKLDPEDLEKLEQIGGGNFGAVYKGDYVGTSVAIKEVVISEDDEEFARKYIEREVAVLRSARHPNILNFIGICTPEKTQDSKSRSGFKESVLIVTEWLPNGNLHKYIRKNKDELTWTKRVLMAIDIASAMAFLNKKNLIHRDLKPENLLITENGRIKICDFGFARRKPKKDVGLMTLAGTEDYMAPEVTLGEDYDEKCDVYSFGVVLYELIGLREPPRRSPATAFDFRADDIKAFVPADCPEELAQLAAHCTRYRSSERPSFAESLKRLKELLKTLPPDAGVGAGSLASSASATPTTATTTTATTTTVAPAVSGATTTPPPPVAVQPPSPASIQPSAGSRSGSSSPAKWTVGGQGSDHVNLPAGGEGDVLAKEKARLEKTMAKLQLN